MSLTEAIRGEKEGDTRSRLEVREDDTPPRTETTETTETTESVPPIVDLRERAELESAYDKDIKYGGLHVHTTVIPELSGDVSVPVLLPDPHGEIECRGTVVKIFEDPPGFAMRLTEVDAVRARLIEIIRGS